MNKPPPTTSTTAARPSSGASQEGQRSPGWDERPAARRLMISSARGPLGAESEWIIASSFRRARLDPGNNHEGVQSRLSEGRCCPAEVLFLEAVLPAERVLGSDTDQEPAVPVVASGAVLWAASEARPAPTAVVEAPPSEWDESSPTARVVAAVATAVRGQLPLADPGLWLHPSRQRAWGACRQREACQLDQPAPVRSAGYETSHRQATLGRWSLGWRTPTQWSKPAHRLSLQSADG